MTPATTAALAAEHERLTRYIHGHFKRKLSLEDAADVAAEAIAEADRCTSPILDREKWLRRAAWRDALDVIRKIEGEGSSPRERPTGLGDEVHRLPAGETTEGMLLSAALHDADTRALAKAAESLKPDEHRVLHLRYIDGLDVPIIMGLIGCSRHHYDNLHKRGLRKLREALVEPGASPSCRQARGFILASALGSLSDDDAARRDAHVESCLPCRAFSKRRDGLIAALPLPAVPAFLSRVAALFAGGSAPAKVVALCGAGACAAVAPIAAPVVQRDLRGPVREHIGSPSRKVRPAVARVETPTLTAVISARLPPSARSTGPGPSARRRLRPVNPSTSRTASASRASPFLPESATAGTPRASTPPRRVAMTATATPRRAPATTTRSSSFSDEFKP